MSETSDNFSIQHDPTAPDTDRVSTNINAGDEEPPSLIPCRVCGSMIDISNRRDQHVVKCGYCSEATVSVDIN